MIVTIMYRLLFHFISFYYVVFLPVSRYVLPVSVRGILHAAIAYVTYITDHTQRHSATLL